MKRNCNQCKTEYEFKHKSSKFCNHNCYWESLKEKRGSKSFNWKGGRILRTGYFYIHTPDHPNAGNQGYVAEHRLVMEKKLGRYLTKSEVVHHKDENPKNNDIDNLELCPSPGMHTKIHHPEAQVRATNASAQKPNTPKQLAALELGRKGWNKGKRKVNGRYIVV